MGLFSRTNNGANGQDDYEDIDLPTSDDLKGGMFSSEESQVAAPAPAPAKRTTPARTRYGIEDAIKLMKSLPRDNNEVVVTVVKKTLESTKIQVTDIVEDANNKETRIRDQHKTLEGEIKELQEQIAQRNQQITDLLQDLKETTDVRQRLQLAMELDGHKVQTAPAQAVGEEQTEASQAGKQNAAPQQPASQQASQQQPSPQQKAPNTAGTANVDPNTRQRAQPRSNPH